MKIKLTQNRCVEVDEKDFKNLSNFNWYYSKNGYAVRNQKGKTILMHREILGLKNESIDVDHINNNRLDNRRKNLRTCTRTQNCQKRLKRIDNKSGFKGVYFINRLGKYQSTICKDGKQIYLGLFKHKKDAAIAYNNKGRELFGKYFIYNHVKN